jgi:hypothetical protein
MLLARRCDPDVAYTKEQFFMFDYSLKGIQIKKLLGQFGRGNILKLTFW